ncbi:hypothetical protein [Antarctobacter heliothermus]|uniref:Uncharacterized protein n=1 Tax=Antarctobacter heliothermus TaxID=74033 RepID=A0A239AZL3_9RHOB|nr:hypothetical protein [Antarctobacter heliothermus]SNS01057.1 hypothetical protein SAMN04488078_1001235 [Antarctobacter heliothermus]
MFKPSIVETDKDSGSTLAIVQDIAPVVFCDGASGRQTGGRADKAQWRGYAPKAQEDHHRLKPGHGQVPVTGAAGVGSNA